MDIKTTNAVSVAEAANLLGLSRRHVLRLIQKGSFATVFKHEGIRGPYLLARQEVLSYQGAKND